VLNRQKESAFSDDAALGQGIVFALILGLLLIINLPAKSLVRYFFQSAHAQNQITRQSANFQKGRSSTPPKSVQDNSCNTSSSSLTPGNTSGRGVSGARDKQAERTTTRHSITIRTYTINPRTRAPESRERRSSNRSSSNLGDYWAVFDRSRPGITLENAPVVVIAEDHGAQDKENLELIQGLSSPDRVKVYKEGEIRGNRVPLGSGYTANGVEDEKLYNETGYKFEDVLKLNLALERCNFNPDSELARAYAAAVHEFYIHEALRSKIAAGEVASVSGRRALIMGYNHVIGGHTPTLLPELTRLGVDWIALVPRKPDSLSEARLPYVLTRDNAPKLRRLYYEEGNVSAIYDPRSVNSRFSFMKPKPVTDQELIYLRNRLREMEIRPFNNPAISVETEVRTN